MADIINVISNTFQSTQLIVVFVIFLFTLFYHDIQKKINTDSIDGKKATERLIKSIKETFWGKSFILILATLLVIGLFLPVLWEIINLSPKLTFDYGIYSFCLIFIFILSFFAWSIWLGYKLLKKIKELGEYNYIDTIKYILMGKQ